MEELLKLGRRPLLGEAPAREARGGVDRRAGGILVWSMGSDVFCFFAFLWDMAWRDSDPRSSRCLMGFEYVWRAASAEKQGIYGGLEAVEL